ncbi:MAG TPA: alpha/beta hydrolase family protein [Candidatus Desulfaltia sp.]|nr:alpha/beta hydrolase family protein [Candidatus Desulfaltia sp.]
MSANLFPRQKENLVLVNAFLTNSLVLRGLIDYLGRFFRVHFIDLPGFIRDVPPLSEVSLENYADYVRRRLDDLGLDSYLLGGISFGFAVISHLRPDERCRGVVAITPYLSARWLNLGLVKRSSYAFLVRMALAFDLPTKVWNHRFFHRVFHWYSDYPAERIDTLLSQMEGRTFFETARIILSHRRPCRFHERPYVLILSHADRTVKNDPLLKFFEENVERLKVVRVGFDHYPLEVTEDYFQSRFPQEDIRQIIGFFGGDPPSHFLDR